MKISLFTGQEDASPVPAEVTWTEFAHLLSAHRADDCAAHSSWHPPLAECPGKKCAAKSQGAAFSPVVYLEGARRGNANVTEVTALVLDVDHASAAALEDTFTKLRAFDFEHLAYSTHNHLRGGPDDNCVRLVLSLSRPVPVEDWPRFVRAFLRLSRLPSVDTGTLDPARLFFFPSRPSQGPEGLIVREEGGSVDVDAILARAEAPPADRVDHPKSLKSNGSSSMSPSPSIAEEGAWGHLMRVHALGEAGDIEPLNTYRAACILARDWAMEDAEALPLLHKWSEAWTHGREIVDDEYFLERLERARRYGTGAVGGERLKAEVLKVSPPTPVGSEETPAVSLKGDASDAADFILARHWSREEGVPVLRHWRGDYYHWTKATGCYSKYSDKAIERDLYQHGIPDSDTVSATKRALVAVPGVFTDHVEIGSWIPPASGPDPLDTATCKNGLLYLPTRSLTPATPGYFSTSCLGVGYDPRAASPTEWLAFLDALWPGDPQSISTLQEWFGYGLTPDARLQKILLLVGPRRSGKGTLTKVMQAILGAGNSASPTLSSLGTNFGLMSLIGKSAAIISDARLGARSDITQIVERLLNVSGEDDVTADRKNREHWTGRLACKVTIVSNELPQLSDSSGALASRFLPLRLRESFLGREDTHLLARLLPELAGVLNWAIEGWSRLRARGYFEHTEAADAVSAVLEDLGSPVGAWLRARCVVSKTSDPNTWIKCVDAYTDFRGWCGEQGTYIPPMITFSRDLDALDIIRTQHRIPGNRFGVYRGLSLLSSR